MHAVCVQPSTIPLRVGAEWMCGRQSGNLTPYSSPLSPLPHTAVIATTTSTKKVAAAPTPPTALVLLRHRSSTPCSGSRCTAPSRWCMAMISLLL